MFRKNDFFAHTFWMNHNKRRARLALVWFLLFLGDSDIHPCIHGQHALLYENFVATDATVVAAFDVAVRQSYSHRNGTSE
jgi:hypothetical protein